VRADADADADALAVSEVVAEPAVDFGASERPGATADTSAANPAVSPAAARMTQRRVRPIRARAASRASAARDRFPGFIGLS
jgi:hypothetical protein